MHAIAWHPTEPGRAYEAGGGGAAWSRDGGETWEPPTRAATATTRGRSPSTRPTPTAGTSPPRRDRSRRTARAPAEAALYRWRGGGPWEELDLGLPRPLDSMPYALARDGRALVAGLRDGRLYESRDGGDTWRPLDVQGLASVVAIAAG